MSRMFFFGFGYVAARLAPHLKAAGWEMAGTTRNNDKVNEMWDAGVEPHIWDGEHPMEKPGRIMKGTTHILHSIQPATKGDVVMHHHRRLLAALADKINWYGYLSTTTVYGVTPDGLVAEDYQTNPGGPPARLRARVEKSHWSLAQKKGLPLHLFRLGAIYGPKRGIFARMRSGQPHIVHKEDHQVSRIHVDDIVATLLASIQNPNPPRIYNVVDDLPTDSELPAQYACQLLGIPEPPVIPYDELEPKMGPAMKAHFKVNRRISNQRIKDELGVQLKYPTFREGFEAIAEEVNVTKGPQAS